MLLVTPMWIKLFTLTMVPYVTKNEWTNVLIIERVTFTTFSTLHFRSDWLQIKNEQKLVARNWRRS